MYTISGRVVVKETGAGIQNLLVVVYDVNPKATSKKAPRVGKSGQSTDALQKLSGNRIGSILTDANGNFELKCDDKEFQVQGKERRPNLALFVMSPEERDAKSGSKILHASPDVRQNAGHLETYLIKVPIEKLREAGHFVHGAQIAGLEMPEMEEMLSSIKTLAKERHEAFKSGKSKLSAELEDWLIEEKKPQQPLRLPNSFDLRLPLRFTTDELDSSNAVLSYDEEGQILLKVNPDTQPMPLVFKGVHYTRATARKQSADNASDFLIDVDKKEFHLRVPRSSEKLSLSESTPSDLYRFYVAQNRKVKNTK